MNNFVIVDLETTGLSKSRHKITEIAAVRMKNNRIRGEFQTLVNPEVSIPRFITKLTGIDNEMVADAPTIDQALPKFLKFLGPSVFVAHNASFDLGFIEYNSGEYLKRTIMNDALCTVRLGRRLLPDLSSMRLASVCEFFDIRNDNAHRAMSDVKATAQVFTNLIDLLMDKGIEEISEILRFQFIPKAKIQKMYQKQ